MTSAIWSALLALAFHRLLVFQGSAAERMWRRRWLVVSAAWVLPLVFEVSLLLAVYLPQQIMEPEPDLPWCHWKKATLWEMEMDYAIVEISLLVIIVQYSRTLCHVRRMRQAASSALSCAEVQEPRASLLQEPSRAWAIDVRLSS